MTDVAKHMDLSLVLPVMNEEENLRPLYQEIKEVLDPMKIQYEILFVDDGSTDDSINILKDLASEDSRVRSIIFTRNFGQTAAMSAGVDNASGETIMMMDADRQNDPHDIPLLYNKVTNEGCDIVVGWRKNRKDKTISRKIPSTIANWIIRKVGSVAVHDLGCSLKAFKKDLIKKVRLYGEMHRFIPLYTSAVGGRIEEVVVNHRARTAGQTKYGLGRTFKVILDLITVKFLLKYSTKPMYFFGGVGGIFFLVSIISASAALIHKFTYDVSIVRSPLLIVTAVFFILSFNFILMGLIAEIQMRTYYESQNKKSYFIKEALNLEVEL